MLVSGGGGGVLVGMFVALGLAWEDGGCEVATEGSEAVVGTNKAPGCNVFGGS